MLKSLRVKNFQSHRDTLLKFSPGVNAIVGDPQSGKTALLRALALVADNRPSGFRYHSHFALEPNTTIEVGVPEGEVTFNREESASYKVVEGGETFEFPKPGVAVPDKVRAILNLSPLNVQSQLDGAFLIGQPPAEIAREINRITKIDLVDRWTAELNRRKHATSMLAAQSARKAEAAELKSVELADAALAIPVIAEAEIAERNSIAKKNAWNKVRVAVLALQEVEAVEAKVSRMLLAQPFVEKAEKNLKSAKGKRLSAELCRELVDAEDAIEKLTRLVGVAGEALSEYDSYHARAEKVRAKITRCVLFIEVETQIASIEAALEELRNEYADRVIEEPICPTCFTPLSGDLEFTRQIILEHL